MINSVSDETFFIHIYATDVYLKGNITADNLGIFSNNRYRHINWSLFNNVQIINTFLENIDKVPNAYPETQTGSYKGKGRCHERGSIVSQSI